jgi:hypothetical protein
MDDLRIRAMDYALQARTSADDDVVALAERIHAFLIGPSQMPVSDALDYVKDFAAELPPPIPHNCDLGKGDQTPAAFTHVKPLAGGDGKTYAVPSPRTDGYGFKATCGPIGGACDDDPFNLDDVKTRLVRQGGGS